METMIDLTPEALAAENVRQGLVSREDIHAEVIRYYRLFIKGKNAEIERLYRALDNG